MSPRSPSRLRALLALLAVIGLLVRTTAPLAAAPLGPNATIEALTGTVICAHDADGAATPAVPADHASHPDDCCTAACAVHASFGPLPTLSHDIAWPDAVVVARPRPAQDTRAPRPPPRSQHAPRGPPTLV